MKQVFVRCKGIFGGMRISIAKHVYQLGIVWEDSTTHWKDRRLLMLLVMLGDFDPKIPLGI